MRLHVKKIKLNVLLFIIAFALRSYTDAVYEAKGITGGFIINLKYIVLIIAITFGCMQIYKKRNRKIIYVNELASVLIVVVVFFVITLVLTLTSGNLPNSFAMEVVKLIIPIVYVFIIINTFDFQDIYTSMVFALIFSIVGYLLEIGTSSFTFTNLLRINFSASYSPFESHYAAGAAMAACVFFMYYRENKILKYVSLLFAFLTFKRVAVVFALVLLILPHIVDINMRIKPYIKRITMLLFVVAAPVYYYVLQPNSTILNSIVGQSVSEFTMGRSEYISRLYYGKYVSGGLGSTTQFIDKNIEMDLIKIFLEMSIIALIIFVIAYWRCSGKNLYSYVYMLFNFFNLLTSHSLSNAFSWICIFLIIACITYKQDSDLSYLKYERKKIARKKIRIAR